MTQQQAGIDVALIGMPAWVVAEPSHSLSIVAGIARRSGARFAVHDINIEFYNAISAQERRSWSSEEINLWTAVPAAELHAKYRGWLEARIDRVMTDRPRLVAFTLNMWTRLFSVEAARYIRRRYPEAAILFGGVDCFVGEYGQAFLTEAACDIICQGEGEIAFADFLADFLETGDWRTRVPGFAYRDRDHIVDTGRVELPTLQEEMPHPAFDLFDLGAYASRGSLPFYFTRGCPFSCRFCSETVNFSKFRCRRPEEAFRELEAGFRAAAKLVAVPEFHLSDSIFNANVRHLDAFAGLIIASGLKFRWGGQGHFHDSFSTELIEKLAASGLSAVFWGLESGSQKVVDLMKKNFRLGTARRIIADCSRAGLTQNMPVLIGFPGEEPEDLAETIEFIIEMSQLPGVAFFTPSPVLVRPNAELHERYQEFGLADNSYCEWSTTDGRNIPAVRLMRCFVACQAQSNSDLLPGRVVGRDLLDGINLDAVAVATDLFALLEALYQRASQGHLLAEDLAEWCPRPPGGGDLDAWLAASKNSAAGRERVIYSILLALRAVGCRHRTVPKMPPFPSPSLKDRLMAAAGRLLVRRRRKTSQDFLGWVEFLRVGEEGTRLVGWAADPADRRPLTIEIRFEGRAIFAASTHLRRDDVRAALSLKAGNPGFDFVLPPAVAEAVQTGSCEFVAVAADGHSRVLPVNPDGGLIRSAA